MAGATPLGSIKLSPGPRPRRHAFVRDPGSPPVTRTESVAAERIERLHELARAAAREGDHDRARSYVRRARRVAERNRLPVPRAFERFTCDRCDAYLRPGDNARVRTRDGHVVVTCECGSHARYPYK
jgi:ribonuclease P protein subunit RPR2